jgi:hypothetical protein
MWKIEHLDSPFCEAKNSLVSYWEGFIENFKVPYVFLSEIMRLILDNAHLTPIEIFDVEVSWAEIQKGQAKRFTDVDEFLEELKS